MNSLNAPTMIAPFEAPAPLPGCPYERVRLGAGLRFTDMARLAWLVLVTAMLAAGCAVNTDAPTPAPAATTEPAPVLPPLNATVAVSAELSEADRSGVAVACDLWREASGGLVDLHPFIGTEGDITVVAGPLENPEAAGNMHIDITTGRPVITLELSRLAVVASWRGSAGYVPTVAGVMAHELGHALGLGHALTGIMVPDYFPRGAPIDPVTVSDLATLRGFEAPDFETCRDGLGFVFASESVPGTSCERLSSSSWCCPFTRS